MAEHGEFTYEELLDVRDADLMRGTGIRPQNNSDSKCGPCMYGGFCECFASVGQRRICDRVFPVNAGEKQMYCKVLGFRVIPSICDSCPTCKEDCVGRTIAAEDVASQGA